MAGDILLDNMFLKKIGARLRSELNDLKRTSEACAEEIQMPLEEIENILNGQCTHGQITRFIDKLGQHYPIDKSDLLLPENDCENGVKIMRQEDSESSSRYFSRRDKDGEQTPYYEYRDTAMSRFAPYKPEWIRQLRFVDDNNPSNPDVAYNNGHFLHQTTFFIGPVNFYYEIHGKRFCCEMNTGDSNYITPFVPHSFTTRNTNEFACILAVTFGGELRRIQKDIYNFSKDQIQKTLLDLEKPKRGFLSLLENLLQVEKITKEEFASQITCKFPSLSAQKILDSEAKLTLEELEALADFFQIPVGDLILPFLREEDLVTVTKKSDQESRLYPNNENPLFHIYPLAKTKVVPYLRGFNMEVLSPETNWDSAFESNLHTYAYNYGAHDIRFSWEFSGTQYNETLSPGDSIYVQPYIKHTFSKTSEGIGQVLNIGILGSLNFQVQKEFSFFHDHERALFETKEWFDH